MEFKVEEEKKTLSGAARRPLDRMVRSASSLLLGVLPHLVSRLLLLGQFSASSWKCHIQSFFSARDVAEV